MAFANWSTNPANNSLVDGITWSNGMLPSQIDDSARQMMADLAVWRDAPFFGGGFNSTLRVGTDSGEGYVTLEPGGTTSSGSVLFYDSLLVLRSSINRPESGTNTGRLVFGNSSQGFAFEGGGLVYTSAGLQAGNTPGSGFASVVIGSATSSGSVLFYDSTATLRASITRPQTGGNTNKLVFGSGSEGFAFSGGGITVPSGSSTINALNVTGSLGVSGGLTVTTGGLSVTAGGLSVASGGISSPSGSSTINGLTVTGGQGVTGGLGVAGGITVSSGGLSVTGATTLANATTVSSGGLTVSSGGFAVTGSSFVVGDFSIPAGNAYYLSANTYLTFNAGTGKIMVNVAGNAVMSIDAAGNIRALGTITPNAGTL